MVKHFKDYKKLMRNKNFNKLSNASAAIIIDEKKILLQKRDNNKNIFSQITGDVL